MEFLQSGFTWIMDKLTDLGNMLINLLPDSPFVFLLPDSEFADIIGWVNYFIPLGTFIAIGESWLVCIGIYYIYQLGLRWSKAID